MGILSLNGDRIVLNGDTISLGGPDPGGSGNVTWTLLASGGDTTGTMPFVTTSVSIVAGRGYLVSISGNSFDITSVTGAGQTWTQVVVSGSSTYNAYLYKVEFADSVTSSGTLSLNGTGHDAITYQIIEITPDAGTTADFGTHEVSALTSGTTSVSDAIAAVDADDRVISFTHKFLDNNWGGLAGTPRAGWTEIGDVSFTEGNWGGYVHSQISPAGGDTTAETTGLTSSNYIIISLPITITGSGGGGDVSATLNSTLAAATLSATAAVPVKATLAATLAPATLAATAVVPVKVTATATLGDATLAATAQVGAPAVNGTLAVTLDAAALAATASVPVKAALAATLAPATLSATASVPVKAALAATLAPATLAATVSVRVKAALTATLAPASLSATAEVGATGVGATLDATLAPAILTAQARVMIKAAGFAILQDALLSATAFVTTPAIPPYDWQPPVDLAASAIIGQALRFMRQSPVARLDPGSEILPALTDAFDRAIDECLDAADWSFASVLAVIPQQATAPAVADDAMPHVYQLPGDLIRIRRVGSAGNRWRIDADVLRCSTSGPQTIRYTARVTRETALPATFQTAVALQIAALLGARWAGGVIAGDDIAMQALLTLKQAMREDSRHAAAERALPSPGLSYSPADDWALEATL